MAYNPYTAANAIYKFKNQWAEADKTGDKTKKNEAAQNAQKYYDELRRNGFDYVADELTASDHTQAKKIVDSWRAVTDPVTGSYKTGVNNPEYNAEVKAASDNSQNLIKQQASDRDMMTGKYGKLENYIYDYNPYESEIGKSIMDGYTWKGNQASDNELATGAASNGGNVDSFAAANAARQQLAFTNAGKQAVLNDYNARIGNIQNTLSNLGIYLQKQDAGMQNTIRLQDDRANFIFDNEQTAKNNHVDNLVKQSAVTGYVPTEWNYDDNIYLNSDGTVRDEFLTEEFDNTGGFTTIINDATAKLATTTDTTERAKLQATIKAATQAKALKTYSSSKYAKWAPEVQAVPDTPTLARHEIDTQASVARDTLTTNSADARYGVDANVKMNTDNNANTLAQIDANKKATLEINESVKDNEEKEDVYAIGSMDEAKLEEIGVDDYGKSAIMSVIDLANKSENAGLLTKAQIIECLVSNSKDNMTNKNQLEKVSKYLGLGVDWLENIEDVNSSDWTQGVKYKQ